VRGEVQRYFLEAWRTFSGGISSPTQSDVELFPQLFDKMAVERVKERTLLLRKLSACHVEPRRLRERIAEDAGGCSNEIEELSCESPIVVATKCQLRCTGCSTSMASPIIS
jgi:hypothetical protein